MPATLEKIEAREPITVENQGTKLFGVLHQPLKVENPPLVLTMHGFASSKHGSNRCYVKLAEQLAAKGIATLRFDFRGAGDSEGDMRDASFDDLIADAVAMTKYATTLKGIDGSRLALFGASLGGAIAVETAAQAPTKALALWAPVASGELWFRDFLTKHPEAMHADPEALQTYRGVSLNPTFRAQFAQLFAYKTLATMPQLPLLHMHGAEDDTVSIAHQEAYKLAANPSSLFITYPEEQHALGFAKAFPQAVAEIVAFFQEHLA